jgi:hypothetical protein
MSPRVASDLLLVGSVPATSTADALRAGAANFADLVFALPGNPAGRPQGRRVGRGRKSLSARPFGHVLWPMPQVRM